MAGHTDVSMAVARLYREQDFRTGSLVTVHPEAARPTRPPGTDVVLLRGPSDRPPLPPQITTTQR